MDATTPPAADAPGPLTVGGLANRLLCGDGGRPLFRPARVRFRCGPRVLAFAGTWQAADGSLVIDLREARADERAEEYAATMPAGSIKEKPRRKAVAK